jgi:hypothetical protein
VDIRVECVTPDGLSGKKRVWFRGIFHLIGILGESPFVSKLQKAESAQHSPLRGCFATCTGQVGVCGTYGKQFPSFKLMLLPSRIHARPSAMLCERKPLGGLKENEI